METQFKSKELVGATERISSPTVNNEIPIKKDDLLKQFEKFCLQQSHGSYRQYEKGHSLAKKTNHHYLIKEILFSYKDYIIDNMDEAEKRSSYKKLDLIFTSMTKMLDVLEHDYNNQINSNLIYFLMGNLLKNIHE